MANKKRYALVSYRIIEKASNGNPEAMTAVVRHFRNYITTINRKFFGGVDEETQKRVETNLMMAILKFRTE